MWRMCGAGIAPLLWAPLDTGTNPSRVIAGMNCVIAGLTRNLSRSHSFRLRVRSADTMPPIQIAGQARNDTVVGVVMTRC